MKEISLHIMDLIENGVAAQADRIVVTVNEAVQDNLLTITISDNGNGVPPKMLEMMLDPFVTTRTTRRVGMGLSLFKAAAERCGGVFTVDSKEGRGTQVTATFEYDHIDRMPLGDMPTSLMTILAGYPEIDIDYTHMYDGLIFEFKTSEIKKELGEIPINEPAVLQHLKNAIKEELQEIKILKK